MLLYSPFPNLPTVNPPTTRCRLRFLSLSPSCLTTTVTVTVTATTTPAAATPIDQNKDFMVDYLVDSLEFSRHEAISALTQVTLFKSSTNPELVLNCLKKIGFNKTQIREIVSSSPKILSCKVDQTLKPKIKFLLQDIGFSVSDIVMIIKKNPFLLSKGLDTCIIPIINYLKELMGSDEKVVQTVKVIPLILSSPGALKRMQLNVEMLRSYGVANEEIRRFIIKKPRTMILNPKRMEVLLSRVDKELGINCDSPKFIEGVRVLTSVSKETLDLKLKMFKSFGWSDLDIMKMSRSQPSCLNMSEDNIRRVLNFLMKELGYTPEYLASHPCLMMYSMDKRVKPRYEVLKILKENKLVKNKLGLYTLVTTPESTFINKYVLRFKDELPDLHEIYRNAIKQ